MAKARNPITFAEHFGISSAKVTNAGTLDVTLAIDTKLFIDPLLLATSTHPEIAKKGARIYRAHFEQVIALLKGTKRRDDPAWKAAMIKLTFPEVRGTCLGYGAASIHGSGFGPKLAARLLDVAHQIVQIGIEDPDLFAAMALFERDIGPDRISDMTTNIILSALADFNVKILRKFGLEGQAFEINGAMHTFIANPYESSTTPLILVPTDVLRELPIAHDWDSVCRAARRNEQLRTRVNEHIAEIWRKKHKRDKAALKEQALSGADAFRTLLDAMHEVDGQPYDSKSDPHGLIAWAIQGQKFAHDNPLKLPRPQKKSVAELRRVVRAIIAQFKHLIERCGLNKELYAGKRKPRHESTAQRLFFAVAYGYCKANDIDIAPEIDTGNGKLDFKFSSGFNARYLVEVKLSTNNSVVTGYTNQLEEYRVAQETMEATYLVIDVGKMGKKDQRLLQAMNLAKREGRPVSDVVFIDGSFQLAPSKRRG